MRYLQVYGVAQRLSGTVPFRSCCFTGGAGRSFKTQAKLLQVGCCRFEAASTAPQHLFSVAHVSVLGALALLAQLLFD